MLVNSPHVAKALSPMLLTLSPIVNRVMLSQQLKAYFPMVVTLSPIVTLVKAEQHSKANSDNTIWNNYTS